MLNVGQICEVCWFELFFGIVQLLTVSQHVRVLVFQFLYFVLHVMFFSVLFFCLSQNWVLEFMADSADSGFVQAEGERNNVFSFGDV